MVKLFCSVAGLLCLLTTALATAWAQVPRATGMMPYYFSGTNCRATGGIVANDGYVAPVFYMELRINGVVVDSWSRFGPGPIPPQELGVMFDSTVFANGSIVTVEFEAWCLDGNHFYDSGQSVVQNEASLYGRFDLDVQPLFWVWQSLPAHWSESDYQDVSSLRQVVEPTLVEMNFHIWRAETGMGWTAAQMLNDSKNANVIYVNTHGNQATFWSDKNDYWYYYPGPYGPSPGGLRAPEWIWALPSDGNPSVKPYRIAANGTGWPPYNSTGLPPANVAFIDACDTGTDNKFAEAFLYPQGNSYVGGPWSMPENQAECGYSIGFQTQWTVDCNQAFWGSLAAGWDVHTARIDLYNAYQGSNKPGDPRELMHVWGDWASRLNGVYTGFLGQESRWFFDGGGLPLDETYF